MEQCLRDACQRLGTPLTKSGKGGARVFNNLSGHRPAEPTSLAAAATHHTLTRLILFAAKRIAFDVQEADPRRAPDVVRRESLGESGRTERLMDTSCLDSSRRTDLRIDEVKEEDDEDVEAREEVCGRCAAVLLCLTLEAGCPARTARGHTLRRTAAMRGGA